MQQRAALGAAAACAAVIALAVRHLRRRNRTASHRAISHSSVADAEGAKDEQRERQGAKDEQRERQRGGSRLAQLRGEVRKAARTAAQGGPWKEQVELLGTSALIAECAAGGDLLVLRAPLRTAALFAEELKSAAVHAQLPPALLRPLGGGLWLLRPAPAADRAAHAARSALLSLSRRLAGVRLQFPLEAVAPLDVAAFLRAAAGAAAVRAAAAASEWTLRYEHHYPMAHHELLPFSPLPLAPPIAIGLRKLAGDGYVAWPAAPGLARETLIVLETKHALVLGRQHRPESSTGADDAAAGDSGGGGDGEGGSAMAGPLGEAAALPSWVGVWERRPFAFSASLDPLIAAAAVRIAAFAHARRGGPLMGASTTPARGLRLLDPCCGSGTVIAAALAAGIDAVSGTDVRSEFADRARANLAHADMRVADDAIVVHDATADFPPLRYSAVGPEPPARAAGAQPDLIVANPPWGRKFGEGGDCVPIVQSVSRQFPDATACWIVNAQGFGALRDVPHARLLHHVALGGVELVVMCRV